MSVIAVNGLRHTNVVVHDLNAAARCYARLLGIANWHVHHWTPERLSAAQAFAYRATFGYSTATGSNASGVTFRLVQPTHGFSTFTEFLVTRGVGVHSFCASEGWPDTDFAVAQAATFDDGSTRAWLDTRRALGGYYVELASDSSTPPDDVWDLHAEAQIPNDVAWLATIPKILHFGVAVQSVTQKLPHYADILGVERWSGVHFHVAPGSLERSVFDGQDVDNAWLLAITDVANFGLELLQSTREPTDYRRTIDRIGEGIHHVLVRRDLTDDNWSALQTWMESMHIGTVMTGRVRHGAADFHYLDTREALGFLIEVIVTRDAPVSSPGMQRFDLDYSRRA
jgi:hypothetical protein